MNVAIAFGVGQQWCTVLHCVQQFSLVDKWNEHDGLPFLFFAIQIGQELDRIVVDEFAVSLGHERVVSVWQKFLTGRWQHSQQLLEWQERFAQIQIDVQMLKILDVTDVRSVVMWVVPSPGTDTAVVVAQCPLQGGYIDFSLLGQNLPMRIELVNR